MFRGRIGRRSHAVDRDDLKMLHDSQMLSDVVVCFSGHEVKAHKLILSLASDYFKAAFTKQFSEATGSRIELHDDDPEAVAAMLQHIYCRYDPCDERGLDIHKIFRLYAVAGKYQLPALMWRVLFMAENRLRDSWRTSDFPELLRMIYEEVPTHGNELRQQAVHICCGLLPALMEKDKFVEVLRKVPDLAVDIIHDLAKEQRSRESALKRRREESPSREDSDRMPSEEREERDNFLQ